MTSSRAWMAYPLSYRSREMATLFRWIQAGEGGSVVGLPGSGKSNLLGFLCHRPDALCSYCLQGAPTPIPVLVDLNNMPGDDLSLVFRADPGCWIAARGTSDRSLWGI